MNNDELIVLFNKYFKERILPYLSENEKKIIYYYTGPYLSRKLCDYQLTGEVGFMSKTDLDNYVNIISSIIEKCKLPHNVVVYHGGLINLNVNDKIFKQRAFLSTSLDYKIAKRFAQIRKVDEYVRRLNNKEKIDINFMKPIMLKIYLPENFHALWMSPFSFSSIEKEILLPNKGIYKIEDIDESTDVKVITLKP